MKDYPPAGCHSKVDISANDLHFYHQLLPVAKYAGITSFAVGAAVSIVRLVNRIDSPREVVSVERLTRVAEHSGQFG
jgi:hypothetical protein